ncbi:uncharacterized protein B0H18DRAFT_962735 [Fomitopsis serialis]|uniref:uncharacterized protein n=1 Tax=Fomitopsis serialis TaxID=139415 RepID=UPI0020073C3B|nr:uncharacterized protein B0H18DRAFT_962735 [Neoantrodia serialis]KAH9910873.1 hypothetical protein B0H18DRAFT_962735 [Neoantrodia serialis]
MPVMPVTPRNAQPAPVFKTWLQESWKGTHRSNMPPTVSEKRATKHNPLEHRQLRRLLPNGVPTPRTILITPLPILSLPVGGEPILEVEVFDQPARGDGRGAVWVVASRPERQLTKNTKIILKAAGHVSGVGRLSSLNGLYRHWASFAISGGPRLCSLRVPIPWAVLGALESHTHSSRYHALPEEPDPHPAFIGNPMIAMDGENPYEFDVWEDPAHLDARLARIRNQ